MILRQMQARARRALAVFKKGYAGREGAARPSGACSLVCSARRSELHDVIPVQRLREGSLDFHTGVDEHGVENIEGVFDPRKSFGDREPNACVMVGLRFFHQFADSDGHVSQIVLHRFQFGQVFRRQHLANPRFPLPAALRPK